MLSDGRIERPFFELQSPGVGLAAVIFAVFRLVMLFLKMNNGDRFIRSEKFTAIGDRRPRRRARAFLPIAGAAIPTLSIAPPSVPDHFSTVSIREPDTLSDCRPLFQSGFDCRAFRERKQFALAESFLAYSPPRGRPHQSPPMPPNPRLKPKSINISRLRIRFETHRVRPVLVLLPSRPVMVISIEAVELKVLQTDPPVTDGFVRPPHAA